MIRYFQIYLRENKIATLNEAKEIKFKKENRRAEIIEETHYVVKMYVGDELAEERPLYGHSRRYAEDLQENWENGVI